MNGTSVFLIKLSDYFQEITRFELITSMIFKLFFYLFFMAIFSTLYALPEEFNEISRMSSLKPWMPVYEDEERIVGSERDESGQPSVVNQI